MIVSKANLQAISIVRRDKATDALNVLYLESDGSTYCVNQQSLMAVEGVRTDVKKNVNFLEETRVPVGEVISIHGDTINDVLSNIPRDVTFKGILEHCDIDSECRIVIHDGHRNKIIKGIRQKLKPLPYKNILQRTLSKKQMVRSVVNLVRLKALLESIEKACGDKSGELPVYLEFSDQNDLIIRSFHPSFNQRVIGIMTTYKGGEGNWLEDNEWEQSLKKPKLRLKLK